MPVLVLVLVLFTSVLAPVQMQMLVPVQMQMLVPVRVPRDLRFSDKTCNPRTNNYSTSKFSNQIKFSNQNKFSNHQIKFSTKSKIKRSTLSFSNQIKSKTNQIIRKDPDKHSNKHPRTNCP